MNRHNVAEILKARAEADGVELSEEDSLLLADLAEKVADQLDADAREAAFQAERRADVAAHVAELRSFGLWDGE